MNLDPQNLIRNELCEREALACEILYLLESEPAITQRELARRMGISLGRAHGCLRGAGREGWIEVGLSQGSAGRKRFCYRVTPAGMAQRARWSSALLAKKRAEHERLERQIALLERQVGPGA